MGSLQALPFEEHDGPLSCGECWVFDELPHPASCSARELTTRAAPSRWHAVVVVKGLTVQTQRVDLVMLENFLSAVISEILDRFLFRPLVCLLLWWWLTFSTMTNVLPVRPTARMVHTFLKHAWYDEHDLRSPSWEQMVGSSFAFLSDDRPVCKFGHSKISSGTGRSSC